MITLLSLQGCAELPSLDHRRASTALQDTAATSLGRTLVPMQKAHAGKSGVFAIADGRDAFAARALLADAAGIADPTFIWRTAGDGAPPMWTGSSARVLVAAPRDLG